MFSIKFIHTSNNTRIILCDRNKLYFQLTSGQLGFKGASRKSSFVLGKLIQQFALRLRLPSVSPRSALINPPSSGVNSSLANSLSGSSALRFNLISFKGKVPSNAVDLLRLFGNSPVLDKSRRTNVKSPLLISDLTPIPFNGCKLKKSRRT